MPLLVRGIPDNRGSYLGDAAVKSVYLIGSLRNPQVVEIANYLETLGFDVFSDWHAASPIADDSWQEYEKKRGRTYDEALRGYAATHIFEFDHYHLNRCHIGVLLMPAGKSGHIELGYLMGQGKPGFVLFDKEPDRWDVMYRFCEGVFFEIEALGQALCKYGNTV